MLDPFRILRMSRWPRLLHRRKHFNKAIFNFHHFSSILSLSFQLTSHTRHVRHELFCWQLSSCQDQRATRDENVWIIIESRRRLGDKWRKNTKFMGNRESKWGKNVKLRAQRVDSRHPKWFESWMIAWWYVLWTLEHCWVNNLIFHFTPLFRPLFHVPRAPMNAEWDL